MTLPAPPHQDPASHSDLSKVTMMEYITTLIATLDRRFGALHQDLKDSIKDRFRAVENSMHEMDLRYQQRDDARQVALKDALTAADRAVAKAETASEKRFDSVNEFRGQLADQAATFMPRAEAEARWSALAEKVDDLKAYQAASAGRDSAVPNTSKQIQDIADQVQSLRDYREMSRGSNLEVRVKELTDQLSTYSQSLTTSQGRSAGLNQGWGYLVGAIGVIATIIAVVVTLTGR